MPGKTTGKSNSKTNKQKREDNPNKNPQAIMFGKYLRVKLAEAELTQQELSTRLGLSTSTVGTWVNGFYMPDFSNPDMINRLAKELGITSEEIYTAAGTFMNDADLSGTKLESMLGQLRKKLNPSDFEELEALIIAYIKARGLNGNGSSKPQSN